MSRFYGDELAVLQPHGKGGSTPTYDAAARLRILVEAIRTSDPQRDGIARWSLTTLRLALRRAPEGLLRVSTYTIGEVLRPAFAAWQRGLNQLFRSLRRKVAM